MLESRAELGAERDGSSFFFSLSSSLSLSFSPSSDSRSFRRALSLSISLEGSNQSRIASHVPLTYRFAEGSVRASLESLLLHRLPLLWQFLHGSWSSHFIRLRRHQSQARVTCFRLGFATTFIVDGLSWMSCKSNELLSVENI